MIALKKKKNLETQPEVHYLLQACLFTVVNTRSHCVF